MLAKNFHPDSALSGNYIGVVVWVNECLARRFDELLRVFVRIRVGLAVEFNDRTTGMHRVNFDCRCCLRHNDCGSHT